MIENKIIEAAKKLHACDLIQDGMSADEIIKLAFDPQGSEFCMKHSFPTMGDIRALEAVKTANDGEYEMIVDSDGYVNDKARDIIVAGNCKVDIICDKQDAIYHIVLFHGAQVTAYAYNYAVVHCVRIGEGCKLHFRNIDGKSVLL